jgi:hypothetical protein
LEAAPYTRNDAGIMTWTALYEDALERVMKSDHRDRYPDGAMVPANEVGGIVMGLTERLFAIRGALQSSEVGAEDRSVRRLASRTGRGSGNPGALIRDGR